AGAGGVTGGLVDAESAVWPARPSPSLALLDLEQPHDPEIGHDPIPAGGPPAPTELTANSLPRDSVRTAPDGEEAVVVVVTPLNSVLLYRLAFSTHWEAQRRAPVPPGPPPLPLPPLPRSLPPLPAT